MRTMQTERVSSSDESIWLYLLAKDLMLPETYPHLLTELQQSLQLRGRFSSLSRC